MLLLSRILFVIIILLLIVSLGYNLFRQSPVLKVCPVDAIRMEKGKAVINPELCIGCGRCVFGIRNFSGVVSSPLIPTPEIDTLAEPVPLVSKPGGEKKADLPSPKSELSLSNSVSAILRTVYQVIKEKCIGCGLCLPVCPVDAITLTEGKAVIDSEKCIFCGICANGDEADYQGCPVQAIIINKSK